MSSSDKIPATDRSRGGPGSSHQDRTQPSAPDREGPAPGQPTNARHSHVSGGGGERDSQHTHDPAEKGKGKPVPTA
jgi:hypothetical protein